MKTCTLFLAMIFPHFISYTIHNSVSIADTVIAVPGNRTVRDGSSFDKAIIINETTEQAGDPAEYQWISTNYPDSKNNSQSLVFHDKKPYDILHITTKDGKEVAVYFDISKFFGKL